MSRLLALALGCSFAASRRPDIVHIVADDLGWADVGYHGAPPDFATPTLASWVARGVELDRFYVHKFCSPSRCALQTGRAPIHVNVENAPPEVRNADDPEGGFQARPRAFSTRVEGQPSL